MKTKRIFKKVLRTAAKAVITPISLPIALAEANMADYFSDNRDALTLGQKLDCVLDLNKTWNRYIRYEIKERRI